MRGYHKEGMKLKVFGRRIFKTSIIKKRVAVHICGFDGIHRGNSFGREIAGRAEVEMRVGKLKNGKAVGKDEITGK